MKTAEQVREARRKAHEDARREAVAELLRAIDAGIEGLEKHGGAFVDVPLNKTVHRDSLAEVRRSAAANGWEVQAAAHAVGDMVTKIRVAFAPVTCVRGGPDDR